MGIETARYEILPLGNNVKTMGTMGSLFCNPSLPSEPLVIYF
jgi:hypothetical protein